MIQIKYLLLIISISYLFPGEIKTASEKYLLSQFSINTNINMHVFELQKDLKQDVQNIVKQKFYRDKLYYWNISEGDSTIAYAFLDNVIGKSMPITFMVILNINGDIIDANVIKYREAYGGEIGHNIWLRQFVNRNNKSDYKVGQDIDGITGATISVNSLSKGIYKIAVLFPLIKKSLK